MLFTKSRLNINGDEEEEEANGALTLYRVGLPSTCRAIKKTQSPERWVLSELVPGRNFF